MYSKNIRFYLFLVYMIAIDEIFHLNYHLEHSDKMASIYLFLQIGSEPVKLSLCILLYVFVMHNSVRMTILFPISFLCVSVKWGYFYFFLLLSLVK